MPLLSTICFISHYSLFNITPSPPNSPIQHTLPTSDSPIQHTLPTPASPIQHTLPTPASPIQHTLPTPASPIQHTHSSVTAARDPACCLRLVLTCHSARAKYYQQSEYQHIMNTFDLSLGIDACSNYTHTYRHTYTYKQLQTPTNTYKHIQTLTTNTHVRSHLPVYS